MRKFQIVAPHQPAECFEALDEMLAHDPNFFEQAVMGCQFGDHTSYGLVEVSNEEEARIKLPTRMRKKARVVEVEHMDPNVIRAMHEAPN